MLRKLFNSSFERWEIFDGDDFRLGGDFCNQAGENFSGADFDELGVALGDEMLDGFDPADGAGDTGGEGGTDFLGRGNGSGGEVRDDGDLRGNDVGGGEFRGEFSCADAINDE